MAIVKQVKNVGGKMRLSIYDNADVEAFAPYDKYVFPTNSYSLSSDGNKIDVKCNTGESFSIKPESIVKYNDIDVIEATTVQDILSSLQQEM